MGTKRNNPEARQSEKHILKANHQRRRWLEALRQSAQRCGLLALPDTDRAPSHGPPDMMQKYLRPSVLQI